MEKELNILLEIESLSGDGSQKAKQELIKNNYSAVLEYLLKVALDPFLTTKLNKLEIIENHPYLVDYNIFEKFKDLTSRLFQAPAANDKLREEAFELVNCSNYTFEQRKMLGKILTKKLNIGIGAKLINKALNKEVIPDPSLMLAEDTKGEVDKWRAIVCEEKYDGVRIIAYVSNHSVKFFTRSFNEIPTHYLEKIGNSCLELIEKSGLEGEWFFDGELTDTNRKSVSGKVTSMLKGKPQTSIGDNFIYNIFDLEEGSTLKIGKGIIPFIIRRKNLEVVFSVNTAPYLILAESFLTTEKQEVYEQYNKIIAKGGEGIIMKNPDHVYECKRSKNWIKMKEVNECDLVIKGWYPGEGKREGLIGGFICEDQSGILKVNIGSGFNDDELKNFTKNIDNLMNKICSVQYNVIINDKHGNWSLFLPRFVEIRHDKNEADNLKDKCK